MFAPLQDEKEQLLSTWCIYNQYWKDEFLTWDPLEYDNISQISLPSQEVWIPDVYINEFVESGITPPQNFLYITHTGLVNYQRSLKMTSMCRFYVYYFPFDQHNCTVTFQSHLHTVEHINVSLWRTLEEMKKDLKKFYSEGEWILLGIDASYVEADDKGKTFGLLVVYVIFRRNPTFYVVNLIIPSVFLIIMDIIGFYIPPESGERISFKITLLLGYSVFLIIVSENLPASSRGTPIIEVYFLVCMALLIISLTESIFIVRIVNKKNIQSKVPKWMKKLLLGHMAVFLHMKDKRRYFGSLDTGREIDTTSTG
ncbi:5-hydroxytryptamine receptor 3A-like [Bufo bufo]|uniref:5-hydroxytryptamine receptor 3A-like n=1 Tax=Bufo bufo TaxID=8384 RepID=UPI001ABE20D4|nr:5-hydroxytryptamine receptor 3A-like [Bufo bufo]